MQAELVIAKRHASAAEERHQQVVADLATATSELKEARSSYNKSVSGYKSIRVYLISDPAQHLACDTLCSLAKCLLPLRLIACVTWLDSAGVGACRDREEAE